MRFEKRLFTPEICAELLKNQVCNRPIRLKRVNTIADDLVNGRWRDNGETIKLDEQGRVIDGQHRLAAIVKSGVSVELFVVEGLCSNVQPTINGSMPNKFSDLLSFEKFNNGRSLAATTRLLWAWISGVFPERACSVYTPPSNDLLLEVLLSHEKLADAVSLMGSLAKSGNCKVCPISTAAFLFYIAGANERDKPIKFFQKLYIGDDVILKSGVWHFRTQMLNDIGSRTPVSPLMRTAKLVKAWNSFYEEKQPSTGALVRWTLAEEFPPIKGVVIPAGQPPQKPSKTASDSTR